MSHHSRDLHPAADEDGDGSMSRAAPGQDPVAAPPQGFLAAGLHLYSSEEDSSLCTFGHVDRSLFLKAIAGYIGHTHRLADDPLSALQGGADEVRATIRYTYALYTPPARRGEEFALALCDASHAGAVPLTYWPGAETVPDLPGVPYVCGVWPGDDHLHAIIRAQALTTLKHNTRHARSVCGRPAHLALRHGPFDRATPHPALNPCPACAWAIAISGGAEAIERELDAWTPAGDTLATLTRLTSDPLIIRRLCEAIITEARPEAGDVDAEPMLVQLLAAVVRHAPVVLVPRNCRDGDCDTEHDPGQPCPAQAACAACSLPAGPWAGKWQDPNLVQCTIGAPCQVLTAIASRLRLRPPGGDAQAAIARIGLPYGLLSPHDDKADS